MKLKFGKHKGKHVGRIPLPYVKWLLTQDWVEYEVKVECLRVVDLVFVEIWGGFVNSETYHKMLDLEFEQEFFGIDKGCE